MGTRSVRTFTMPSGPVKSCGRSIFSYWYSSDVAICQVPKTDPEIGPYALYPYRRAVFSFQSKSRSRFSDGTVRLRAVTSAPANAVVENF